MWPLSRGRQSSTRTSAAKASRRSTVPPGPSSSNSVFANAAPNWTDAAPAITSASGGTRSAARSVRVTSVSPQAFRRRPGREEVGAPGHGRGGEHRGDPERQRNAHVRGAQEAVAHGVDEVEDRVEVRDLRPRRAEPAHRVEDPAQERQRQDEDVVDERVMVERLGVDPDDHAERRRTSSSPAPRPPPARAARAPARPSPGSPAPSAPRRSRARAPRRRARARG